MGRCSFGYAVHLINKTPWPPLPSPSLPSCSGAWGWSSPRSRSPECLGTHLPTYSYLRRNTHTGRILFVLATRGAAVFYNLILHVLTKLHQHPPGHSAQTHGAKKLHIVRGPAVRLDASLRSFSLALMFCSVDSWAKATPNIILSGSKGSHSARKLSSKKTTDNNPPPERKT